MNTRFLKLFTVASALFFLCSCAVFVRDGGYHHRGYWRRHSSLQQSNLPTGQMTALNSGEAQDYNQARR
jgi:hypothetical protein